MNSQPGQARLTVRFGQAEPRDYPLDPRGVLIGRSSQCAVQLDDGYVSRRHATIFRDPFGRWIIEDLASRNGIAVNRQQVKAAAIGPADEVSIGPFHFRLTLPAAEPPVSPEQGSPTQSAVLVDDTATAELTAQAGRKTEELSRDRVRRLNQIASRLAALTRPADLYPEICRLMSSTPKTAAAVLRLATLPGSGPEASTVLASHCCRASGQSEDSPENLRLSQSVLRAVRASGEAVSASSRQGGAVMRQDLALTVMDAVSPRRAFCAPASDPAAGAALDVLYVDVPAAAGPGDDMLDFVAAVARQANYARKSLSLAEETARRRVLDQELETARKIQQRMTPSLARPLPNLDVAIHYQPAMWVGGDYCDIWPLADGRVALALGDVSGKGLPAAMLMTNLQGLLRTAVQFCPRLADAINHVNRQLCDSAPDGFFVTLFFALLDPATGRLEYVNAGHMSPILLPANGPPRDLCEPACPPLGVLRDTMHTAEAQLETSTGLLAFSDGVTEASAPDGELFGVEGIKLCVAKATPEPAREIIHSLTDAVLAHRQHLAQHDDLTILALRRRCQPAAIH